MGQRKWTRQADSSCVCAHEEQNICCYKQMGCYSPYNNWPWSVCFMLVSCLAYSSTLKTEVICSSKMSINFQRTTWRYIQDDRRGFDSQQSQFFLFPTTYKPALGHIKPSTERKLGHFPQSKSICSMKLTTHIYLVPRLGIHEGLLFLGSTIHIRVWNRNNFKFTIYLIWKLPCLEKQMPDWLRPLCVCLCDKISISTHPLCCCCWVLPFCKICRQNNKTPISGSDILTAVVMKSAVSGI
jgi:hypothetical protein